MTLLFTTHISRNIERIESESLVHHSQLKKAKLNHGVMFRDLNPSDIIAPSYLLGFILFYPMSPATTPVLISCYITP